MANGIAQTLDEVSSDYQKVLADLRGLVYEEYKKGRTYKEMAAEAYMCAATVQRFAEGTTKRPSDFTVRQIAKIVRLRVELVPMDDPEEARKIG